MLALPSAGAVSAVVSVKEWLLAVSAAVNWLSPVSYLGRGVDGLMAGEPGSSALILALTILYAGAVLSLAVVCLNRKGVVRP